jgi:acetoin utilization protein AcuB
MKIREAMRPGAFTIQQSDSLGAAHRAMTRARIRHLPVMHDGKLVGILSERDLLAVRARGDADGSWWEIPVLRAMSSPVQTAHPDDALTEVAGRLAAHKLGAMPIVEHGKLVGLATVSDVLNAEVRSAMTPAPGAFSTAADVMTPFPVTIGPNALLVEAVNLMLERHVRHLPVIDDHSTIVGLVSDRDLRTVAGDPANYPTSLGHSLFQPRVRDAMTTPVAAVAFDMPIDDLARKFIDEKIGAVPVVDRFGALMGVVSYVDLLRAFAGPR